ncbi:MAG: GNAT family N-acetyltransferase, partial [Acidimicrobiia bacterium]|nr:GNAT family N-acetyltransferase [Acidimicrobiia bacterium]
EHATLTEMVAPLGDRAGYATLDHDGRAVAVGTAAVSGPRATVANLHTQPADRGQGHGRAVLDALHRWAHDRGATSAFLNVRHDNTAAQRLYQSAGYTFAYSYRYLEAPA